MKQHYRIYRSFSMVFVLLLLTMSISAQRMSIRIGDKNFKNCNYAIAVKYYENAYSKDSMNSYVIRRLAEANDNIGNTVDAEKWLHILIRRKEFKAEDLYNYAMALKSNGKYHNAEYIMDEYVRLCPDNPHIETELSMIKYIQSLMRDSARYIIKNVSVNTRGSDIGPSYYKNDIVFSSTSLSETESQLTYGWNNLPYLDMYITPIDADGDLSRPKPFVPKLKGDYHDGPMCYDAINNRIFYTTNDLSQLKKSKTYNKLVALKINIAREVRNRWEYKESFRYNSSKYSVGHPAIDSTGTILYFVSDMPGGYGGADIYFSVYENGQWGTPQNMGPNINTAGSDVFPFIGNDGALFFASDGHGGMGGLDIFVCVPEEDGTFKTIQNMGYPLNSSGDDFALVLDQSGEKGYFTSNRKGGNGYDDIYSLSIIPIPVVVTGNILDSKTKKPIENSVVSVIDESGDTITSVFSDANGDFKLEVHKNKRYTVSVGHSSYTGDQIKISTDDLHSKEKMMIAFFLNNKKEPKSVDKKPITLALDKSKKAITPSTMEKQDAELSDFIYETRILYDFNKWDVKPVAANVLDALLIVMREYPELKMQVKSFADSRGTDVFNNRLSKNRSKTVVNYFVKRGINPKRIKSKSYGENELMNKCSDGVYCTEKEHAENRRSIIRIARENDF